MHSFVKYLNIPCVPDNFIESIDQIINKQPKPESLIPSTYKFFQTRLVSQDLNNFIKNLFCTNCFVQYQIVQNGLHIHKDKGRNVAFNYLIDTGGEESTTCFYDDAKRLIQSEIIIPNVWHRIKTDVNHNVINCIRPRVAISVHVYDYNWDDNFLHYTEIGPA